MMKRSVFVFGLILACCTFAWSQAKPTTGTPNFAGTWVLDVSKSKLPEMRSGGGGGGVGGGTGRMMGPRGSVTGQTLTVTQDAKQLTVATDTKTDGAMEMPPQTNAYNLDGSESTSELKFGMQTIPAKLKASWDAGKLTLDTVATADGPQGTRTITTKQVWELADGGKTLKVHRTRETMRGTDESDWVYTKQ
jgi:hypothetical protein